MEVFSLFRSIKSIKFANSGTVIYCWHCRMIKRMSWATAASQDSRFCCRNSWRGNRCRKRWPSSYEKGIAPQFLHVTHPGPNKLFPLFSTFPPVLHKTEKCTWKESGCIMVVMSNNETLYFLLRIKIEEEYSKNLSKLSQFPLAGQEEGSATFVPKVSLSKKLFVKIEEAKVCSIFQPLGGNTLQNYCNFKALR